MFEYSEGTKWILNYAGYWIGEIAGTNKGGMTFALQQTGNKIVGVAKISEPALGQSEYQIVGVATEVLALELTPAKKSGNFFLELLKLMLTSSPA